MSTDRKHLIGLVFYVGTSLALAAVYAVGNVHGLVHGIGRNVQSGSIILLSLVVVAAFAVRRELRVKTGLAVALIVVALFLEYIVFYVTAWVFAVIGSTLLAQMILFNRPRSKGQLSTLMVIVVYIEAVCIYDVLKWGQMTYFFKPGWVW